MLYTILCYNCEDDVHSWPKEKDDEVMGKLIAVQDKIAKRGRLGPVARLGPTRKAKTLHKDHQPFHLTDGPYAETKEQILGFYVLECDTEQEAIDIARELGHANPGGAFEVRPLIYFAANGLQDVSVT
ncbi:MAG TPA: YciI family protein [Gemmatimonadaceae bacterium]|nr:YciI family protein [Gemmatimonadaceae bacterium]